MKHQIGHPRKLGVAVVKGVEKYVFGVTGPATTILAREERTEGSEAALYFDDRTGGRTPPRVLTVAEKWMLQGGTPEALAAATEIGVTDSKIREYTAMGVPPKMAEGLTEQ